MATYFDANNKSSTKYTNIKKVHDDALNGYVKAKGTMERPNSRYGNHMFTHVRKFPCVKKPPCSKKDAYYASITCDCLYGTISSLRYQIISESGTCACCGSRMSTSSMISFASSQSFVKSSINMSFLLRSSGEFYIGYQPSNSEIDTMLQMEGDGYSPWMTLLKGGDWIHAPPPEPSRKSLCLPNYVVLNYR
jgi:hypothetical protein